MLSPRLSAPRRSAASFLVCLLVLLAWAPQLAAAKNNKLICASGTWMAEGLPPLAIGDERSLGDAVVVDLAAQTVRISGCEAVPATIKGNKFKAEFPLGACPGVEGIAKFKGSLKEECGLLKAKLTTPTQKRKLLSRRVEAVVPVLEEQSAVEETIGPAGGSLETTDSGGRRYHLEIPEGAIPAERLVRLTPVVAISGLALDRLLAAADFEPAGLRLAPPATLTVELPEPPSPEGLVGFAYRDDRHELELQAALADASTLSTSVWHFSGVGAGSNPSAAAQSFAAQAQAAAGDPQLLTAVCATWFDGQLEPALSSAVTDAQLAMAISDLGQWQRFCSAATDSGRLALSLALIQAALERGVQRLEQECRALHSFEAASDIQWLGLVALAFGVANGALEPDAIHEAICVEVSYVDTSYPGNPPVGVNQTLSVTVGASFDGSSPVFTQPLQVDVTATGASPANGGGQTNGSGNWSGSFAVDGGQDAQFVIESCIAAPAYQLASICQSAIVVRGLEVAPGSATLAGGDTQQFDAMRFGASYTNVTWSASGGSISSAGLYTAPGAVGSYFVTATDMANPDSTATASVTVTSGGGGSTGCVAVNVGQLTHLLSANVQMNDQSDFSGSGSSSGVSTSLGGGGCLTTGTSSGFGNIQATITADAEGCPGTVRAGARSLDHVGITPADPTRFVATVRGRFELELTGSSSPAQPFPVIEATFGAGLGFWLQPGFVGFPDLESGSSIQEVRTLDVELQNQPAQKTFPMAWRVDVQAHMLESNHSANVTARARWLGFTELLDQDGAPILDYEICSNSGTDYRNAVP